MLAHSIVPALTVLLVWTNERHGMVWAEIGIEGPDTLQAVVVKHGPWFRVFTLYTYLTILISVLLILGRFKQTRHQRSQALIMASVPLAVAAFNVAYLFEIPRSRPWTARRSASRWGWFSAESRSFASVSSICCPLLGKLSSTASATSVVVFDRQDRVADLNPSALELLDI